MRSKVLNDTGTRVFAVVFDAGEEALGGLTRFAEEQNLTASSITAIGAFSDVVLGWFDIDRRDYERITVDRQVEVLSLIGDVSLENGRPKVHVHVVVGLRDGHTRGGHLLAAHVRPTLEVIVTESPAYLKREHDPQSGLALIRIGE